MWDKLFLQQYTPNNYFDKIYFINLDKRSDRYNSITNQLFSVNIFAQKISGVVPLVNTHQINNGQLGCLLSHKLILEDCLYHRYEKILIFEDDTIFKDDFLKNFDILIHNLPTSWDMVYLCGNHYGGLSYINEHINKSYGTLSTSSYGVHINIIPYILSILNTSLYTQPIDSIYCSIHSKINTFASKNNLCYQMAGFSDIENRYTDYDILK